MNKDLLLKAAATFASAVSAVCFGWTCWMSSTVVAHGQGLAALEIRCQTLEKTDDKIEKLLKEVRDDIKKLLERR